jgi:hypothetical protein
MKMLRKKIRFTVEKTDTGFSAYSEKYPIYQHVRKTRSLQGRDIRT